MEPIKININVTLDASDKLLQAVQALTGAKAPKAPEQKPGQPVEMKPAPKPETKEAPAPRPATPAEPVAKDPEPVADMPAEIAEISDEELRAIIKETRTASSPAAVRALFNEFGIKTSIECPMERRAELVAKLKKLAA